MVIHNLKGNYKNITIGSKGVFINGKKVEDGVFADDTVKNITIVVNGNVGSIETENGDVEVKGNVEQSVEQQMETFLV